MPRQGGPRRHVGPDGETYWEQRIAVAPDPLTRQRHQQRIRGKSRAEVETAVAQVRAEQATGLGVRHSPLTVRELAEQWLERDVRPRMRPSSVKVYSDIGRVHILPLLGNMLVQAVTPEVLDHYYARLTAEGTSNHMQGCCHRQLRAMLSRAFRLGIIRSNPTLLVRPAPHVPRHFSVWTAEQTRHFLEVAQGSRYGPVWLVLAATGMRRGEALGLRWQDVDWAAGELHIEEALTRREGWRYEPGGLPKTSSSRRVVPVPPTVLEALRRHQEHQDAKAAAWGERWPATGLVFVSTAGTPIQPPNLYEEYRQLEAAAGLPHIRTHDWRHSAATQARESGASLEGIAGMLGHKNAHVTQKLYVHLTKKMVQDAARHVQLALFPEAETAPFDEGSASVVPAVPEMGRPNEASASGDKPSLAPNSTKRMYKLLAPRMARRVRKRGDNRGAETAISTPNKGGPPGGIVPS